MKNIFKLYYENKGDDDDDDDNLYTILYVRLQQMNIHELVGECDFFLTIATIN